MKFAERNFGMWLIGRSIKVDQEAGQKGRVTRRKGSLEKQVTQAVLLGQNVLAAGYKMGQRMSPEKKKRECSGQTGPDNRRVKTYDRGERMEELDSEKMSGQRERT